MTKTSHLIDLLLPHKERFTAQNAGAVSTVVDNLSSYDTANTSFRIFGSAVETPLNETDFHGLSWRKSLWRSQNSQMAESYLAKLEASDKKPDIIEVHGRAFIAQKIAKARPDIPVILYLHNDPRTMKGSKTVQQRRALIHDLAGLISVSHYIENCFFDDITPELAEKLPSCVNWLGVNRRLKQMPKRKKQILMAGRMVPEKGFLEAATGLLPILQEHTDWQVILAGGKTFTSTDLSAYEKQLRTILAPLGDRAVFLGHRPLSEVRTLQEQSEICIVPSLWEEPGGTAVLEAMAAGSALITTKRGGLPEVAEGRALIIDNPTVNSFEEAVRELVSSDEKRHFYQQAVWQDFPFSAQKMAERANQFRSQLLSSA